MFKRHPLRVVRMFPDVIRMDRIKRVFSIEQASYTTRCTFSFMRSFRDELLGKPHETRFVPWLPTVPNRAEEGDILACVWHGYKC